jgi:hypothetical protein
VQRNIVPCALFVFVADFGDVMIAALVVDIAEDHALARPAEGCVINDVPASEAT